MDSKSDKLLKIFLFLFNPFLGLINVFFELKRTSTFYYLFFLGLLFGLAFTPNQELELDSNHYLKLFNESDISSINQIDFISEGRNDIFAEIIIYFVKNFIYDDYHVFFLVVSFIFCFFAIKSLKFLIVNDSFENRNLIFFLIFLYFMMSNTIFNINGVRYWTAAWITVFVAFNLFLKNKKWYILFLLILPFIHTSFYLVILIILISLIKLNNKLLVVAYIISLFLSSVIFEIFGGIQSLMPSSISYLIENYTSTDLIKEKSQIMSGAAWFVPIFDFLKKYYIQLLLIVSVLNINKLKSNGLYVNFVVIFGIFVNLCSDVPSLGTRLNQILIPFVCYLWVDNFTQLSRFKYIIYLIPIVLLLDIYEFIKFSYNILDPHVFVFPPLLYIINLFL